MKKNLFNVFLVCVFCVAAIPDMFAQQIKVTGKVTDSTNEGMPGVNVQVKGTATGTITVDKFFEKQQAEGVSQEDTLKAVEKLGQDVRALVFNATGIDTHLLYNRTKVN